MLSRNSTVELEQATVMLQFFNDNHSLPVTYPQMSRIFFGVPIFTSGKSWKYEAILITVFAMIIRNANTAIIWVFRIENLDFNIPKYDFRKLKFRYNLHF